MISTRCVSLSPSQFTIGNSGSVMTIGGNRRTKIRKKALSLTGPVPRLARIGEAGKHRDEHGEQRRADA